MHASTVPVESGVAGVSFARRLVARLLDELVVVPLAFLILLVISLYAVEALGIEDRLPVDEPAIVIQFVFFITHVIYWTVLHAHGRQTVGKLVVGAVVVRSSTAGGIGYGRAALREIATIVSLLPCGLGILWAIWDRDNQMFHDKIARTVVAWKSDLGA